jgi:hypothetical protein
MQTNKGQSPASALIEVALFADLADREEEVAVEERKGRWFVCPADRKGRDV